MAYHPRKTGIIAYTKKKAKVMHYCICCYDQINNGDEYYCSTRKTALCLLCYNEWNEKGGILGNVSRFNQIY